MTRRPALPEVLVHVDTLIEPRRSEVTPATSRLPWYALPLAIFVFSRIVDAILLVVAARHQMPASFFVSNGGIPVVVDPPSYGHVIANWDGQWYRSIAEHGYPTELPRTAGVVQQNPWAFYPLFPGAVALVMLTGLSYGAAASVVSLTCGALAMCLLFRMLEGPAGRFVAGLGVLALCFFPAASVLQSAYTESMALLLVLAALWCLRERRYAALLGVCVALALTRPIALPLALVVGIHWIGLWRDRGTTPFPASLRIKVAAVAAAVAATFLIWPLVAAVTTGEVDAYFVTQRAWVAPTSAGWPSWLALALSGQAVGLGVCVLTGLLVLSAFVLRPSARVWGLELRAWALVYPLYILASAPPASSVFRYLMLAAVPWWPLPEVRAIVSRPARVAICVAVIGFGLFFQAIWVEWYFVVGPHVKSYP